MPSKLRFAISMGAVVLLAAIGSPQIVSGRAAQPAPPLPPPSGAVVNVATEAQLQTAIRQIASNTTIVLAPGTYQLTSTLVINGTFSNVAIRGGSNNPDDVVLRGPGMTNPSYGNVPYGIWTGGNVRGVTIANLTIRDLYNHPIIFNGGTQSPHVYNVHLINAGQQFIKSNPDGAGGGVNNGIVEYSVIEYSTTAPTSYTNGVDVHTGANWIIRDNLFRNIVSPGSGLAGPAVLMWNHSSNTLTERNLFLNCARGIAYGLQVAGYDHIGGIIRNNVFFRASGQSGDVGIMVADSPNTQVLNNTVFVSGTYGTPIEYRYSSTTNTVVANNLLDGVIWAREGATGIETHNLPGAAAALFVNADTGDLHLKSTATSAIDRGATLSNVVDDWDGDARPQGAGYDIGADEYGATPTTYTIGGRIVNDSGIAVGGVTLTLSGSRTQTSTTDSTGGYAFASLAGGGSYTIRPSTSGYTFAPVDLFYGSLASNITGANFVAAATPPPPPPPPPAPSGLAIDVVTSVNQTSASSNRITTPAFSTRTANELLLAFVAADDPTGPGTTTVSTVAGGGLVWQLVKRTNVQAGSAEIWRAFAPATLAGVSVSITLSHAAAASATVVGFSGADPSGTSGSGAIGAIGSGSATSGAPTASLTTTRANSWVFGVGNDFDRPIGRTPGSNQVLVHQYMPSVGDTYWVQRTVAPTPASGTRVAIYDTAPTGDRYNLTICEILPATGGPAPAPTNTPPTVGMTAPVSGSVFTAPATITLAASATATSAITKVDFYAGSTVVGTAMTAPYALSVNNVTAGTYSLTAVATDSQGLTARSAAVSVTVNSSATPPPPTTTPPPPTSPGGLVQSGNLAYQGAFRLPSGTFGGSTFSYGGTALAFNPNRGSLFVVGHDWDQQVAEVTIPSIRNSSTLANLATATVLQPFTDATEGKMSAVGSGTVKVGGLLPYQGQLYMTAYVYYDAAGTQVKSHFVRGLDLGIRGTVRGPYQVGTVGAGFVSGYLGMVPAAWQAALGGPMLTGNCCLSIITRTSYGPAVFAMDPTQLGAVNPLPAAPLVYYPSSHHTLGDWNVQSTVFNSATEIRGVVFPEGTRSVLFFGRQGLGPFCYGTGGATGGDCYDPADTSKGTHAYPYRYYVWAYDANDLAAVKGGLKQPWDVVPYAVWSLPLPFASDSAHIQGATYDPATNRLFVSQAFGDDDRPVIHVFSIVVP